MASIYVPCPRCGEEIEVGLRYHAGEWDTNTPESWEAEDFTRSCDCETTDAEDDAIAAQAAKDAHDDPEFGVHDYEGGA